MSHDPSDGTTPAVTYNRYLHIDELLELQRPRSEGPEHDELLFIVIHQVYELWFKELLHELDRASSLLEKDDAARAQHTMKRVLTILKVAVAQARSGERIPVGSVPSARVRRRLEGRECPAQVCARQPGARGARAAAPRAHIVGRVSALPFARGLRRAERLPEARRHNPH